ncbi:MAG: YjjG family noncanonical pyrimidine nucleotidase [Oscillospiraceae bacterium]|nr:YjjG family noncanonical pyrimidine nucleotidase [Oscillospiraceae bacterium]
MAYNCLLLDADDTLLSFKDCEKQAFIKVFEKYNITATEENVHLYHNINEGLWQDLEKGRIKKHLIGKIRFQKFCEAVGADTKNAEKMNRDYMAALKEEAVLIDGAIEFLEDVEDYATIAIVTNGIEAVQMNRLKICGIADFADGIYTSEKVGATKPNKQIFLAALKDLGVENTGKVLVIGDRLQSDIKGGINAGLDTCWVNFDNQENTTNIKPTYTVQDYTQLKNRILEGLDDVIANKGKVQL